MPSTLVSGEQITVLMELGFPVNKFTLNDPVLGVLGGEGRLDGTLLGDDVSPYIQQINITRGRSSQLDEFSAGRTTIILNNNDRRFDPINESSPYWDPTANRSGVTPRRKVTVRSGTTDLFVGRIADINLVYNYNLSTVEIIALDDFVLLANTFTAAAVTPVQELSGDRVEYLLDLPEIDYPADSRDIQTGVTTLGAYQIPANTNALAYLQQIAEAERGLLFVSADGKLTFTDRIGTEFGPSVYQFTDNGPGLKYTTLDIIYGQELLYNRIQVTRVGGTIQTANDLASQAEFLVSTYALDNMLFATDTQALDLANLLLAQFSQPEYRFDNMRTVVSNMSSVDRNTVLGIEIGDLIDITRTYTTGTPASVTQPYAVERIYHFINNSAHTIEFGLRFTDVVYPFTLDDDVYGLLDAGNAVT